MNLPKKAFDIEYATQYRKEYTYLLAHGIQPTFIKHTKDFNVPVYKYKKTPELFGALCRFYEEQRNTNEYDSMLAVINSADTKIDGKYGDTISFDNIPADKNIQREIRSLVGDTNA